MNRSNLTIGARVTTNRMIDVFPHGVITAGTSGTVVDITPSAVEYDDILCQVLFDETINWLADWDNVLHVYPEFDDKAGVAVSDATLDAFDLLQERAIVIESKCPRFNTVMYGAFLTSAAARDWLLGDACQADEHDADCVLHGRPLDLGDVTHTLLTGAIA